MSVIRGTDFDEVRLGNVESVPTRFIALRHAQRKTLRAFDIIFETAGGSRDRPTGRSLLLTPSRLSRFGKAVACASFARFLRVSLGKADPAYVFWLLHLYNSRELLRFNTQHTGVARFQFTTFANTHKLHLPAIDIQRRIAGILSAYDDLIEANARRMAVLEEMVRRLFDQWFVKFQFPDSRKESSSELPKGWSQSTTLDVSKYINRGIAPRYDDSSESFVINQKCIRNGRLNLKPARRQSRPAPEEKLLRRYDVLINSTGVGTLGRVGQVFEVPDRTTVDTHVTIVRPHDNIDPHFFGVQLLSMESELERAGVGSTGQTELGRATISGLPFLQPPKQMCTRFGQIVGPMREEIHVLLRQNAVLSGTRDLLLPKLISGEVEVRGAGLGGEHAALATAAQ
jgi:restriction endonuclease S subunit